MINEDALYSFMGARLKAIRTGSSTRSLTQEKLAVIVGLERTSITNIEAGKQRVPLHVIYALCNALGVEIFEVLPRVDDVVDRCVGETVTVGKDTYNVNPQIAELIRNTI